MYVSWVTNIISFQHLYSQAEFLKSCGMKVLTSKGLTKFWYVTIKKKKGQQKFFMEQQGK